MKTFHKTERPTLSPLVYSILGSIATIGLLAGTLTLIPKSASNPLPKNPIEEKQQLEARGSGRDEFKDLLLRVEGLLQEIVEEAEEEEEEEESEIATKKRRRKKSRQSP